MKFTINAKPQPKQRPRVTRYGTYTPKQTVEYERLIGWEYLANKGKKHVGAINLSIRVVFKIPKSRKDLIVGQSHTQRPDLDNICKSVTDSLNGLAYDDDGQISTINATKEWGLSDFVEVEIREVENDGVH